MGKMGDEQAKRIGLDEVVADLEIEIGVNWPEVHGSL
jgi:hypothetical protein